MTDKRQQIIKCMKEDLLSRVDEWVGVHIPNEGTEDFESWEFKQAGIDAIETIYDVVDYLESECLDVEDFFLCGDYEIISAGMSPTEVPSQLIMDLGERIAEQSWSGGSCVYLFDGKYFVIVEENKTVFDDVGTALKAAGIGQDTIDETASPHVASPK